MPDTRDVLAPAVSSIASRQKLYALYTRYYAGDHKLSFATEKFANAFGSLMEKFSENVCESIVDAVTDRLIIEGFEVKGGTEEQKAALWDIWERNRMDQYAVDVHQEAVKCGDGYVIVWPDANDRAIIYPQKASMMTVQYDEETGRTIEWAAKMWLVDQGPNKGKARITFYYPDRLERYITRRKVDSQIPDKLDEYEPFEAPNEPWPVPNPYNQVPVFHFPNLASTGSFGRSELAPVVPLQNAVNKTRSDQLVAQEFVAFPQRWVTGIQTNVDPITGQEIAPFEPGVERLWTTPGKDVRFGEFTPHDLASYLEAIESWYLAIARVSRTPLHYLIPRSGQFPSGESLKTSEAPFVSKVRRKQVVFGNVWENVMRFASRIEGRGDDFHISTLWKSAESRPDDAELEERETEARITLIKAQAAEILFRSGFAPSVIEQVVGLSALQRMQNIADLDPEQALGRAMEQVNLAMVRNARG